MRDLLVGVCLALGVGCSCGEALAPRVEPPSRSVVAQVEPPPQAVARADPAIGASAPASASTMRGGLELPAAAYRELGLLRFRELRYREARVLLSVAVELAPEDAQARNHLERTKWILGEGSCAGAASRDRIRCRTFSIEQTREECRSRLREARTLLDAGRPDQAAARCERVHETLRWFPYDLGAEHDLRGETRRLLEEAWPVPAR